MRRMQQTWVRTGCAAIVGMCSSLLGCGGAASADGAASEEPAPEQESLPAEPGGMGGPVQVNPPVATTESPLAPTEPAPMATAPDEVPPEPPMDVPAVDLPLRDCGELDIVAPQSQSEIDALAGCTSLYGLELNVPLDLRPLRSLRTLGVRGLKLDATMSLAGLENLEQAELLFIRGSTPDLNELRSLRRIHVLHVVQSGLNDLSGLTVTVDRELSISANAQLRSLAGVSVPSEIGSTIHLRDCPLLEDIEALRPLTSIGSLEIGNNVPISNLDVFENLRDVTYGRISLANDALVDITGLAGLRSLHSLSIEAPQLVRVPDFSELTTLTSLSLRNTPLLTALPSFPRITTMDEVEIYNNASLVSLTGLASLESVRSFSVVSNPALAELDLGNLREATAELWILNNGSLDGSAVFASLAGVQTAGLLRVAPDQLVVTQQPCPWAADTQCDERLLIGPTMEPLCALGTDPVCLQEL
jgi:hypothetical protein